MQENDTVIEPEVLDENGHIIQANEPPKWNDPNDHARPHGDLGGMIGGFLTLAIGFLVTIFVLLVSVCILVPFSLILRVLGVRKHN